MIFATVSFSGGSGCHCGQWTVTRVCTLLDNTACVSDTAHGHGEEVFTPSEMYAATSNVSLRVYTSLACDTTNHFGRLCILIG
jgi:hypothetical protein